jgi:hypothetical protein
MAELAPPEPGPDRLLGGCSVIYILSESGGRVAREEGSD